LGGPIAAAAIKREQVDGAAAIATVADATGVAGFSALKVGKVALGEVSGVTGVARAC